MVDMDNIGNSILTAFAIALLSVGCRHVEPVYHEDYTRHTRQGRLVHEECVENVYLTAEQIKKVVCTGKDKDNVYLSDRVRYGVRCYKVRYWTVAMHPEQMSQQFVYADALLMVPDHEEGEELPYASYFHGTIPPMNSLEMIAASLPSNFKGTTTSKDMMYCALPLASAGYCVIAPDYTGYGPTAGWIHPFIYYPELYKSAFDGLTAGVAMADSLGIRLKESLPGKKKIWLTGWSQGGGLSMYMQRRLEMQNGNAFTVMANSVLAAPCNCYHMITDLFEPDPDGNRKDEFKLVLALYSWATYCFNVFAEELRRPFDQIFRMDIYSQIGALLVTPQKPSELYQDFFIKHIEDSTDVDFINAMKKNCTHEEWNPQAPLIMHHGKDDILVNYFNMEDAIKGLNLEKRTLKIDDYTQYAGYTELADSEPDRSNYVPGHDNFVPKYMAHTIDCFNVWREKNGD